MIQILLVDDHPSVMAGTKMFLEQEGDMDVFLAHSSAKALEIVKTQHFDVMLLDLRMPDINGLELAKQILLINPGATIIIYTGFEYKHYFNIMIEAGISGVILKTANKEQLVTAVRCALRGEVILPLSLVRQLRRTTYQLSEDHNGMETQAISKQDYDILVEISKGKSNKEIAEKMIMSQRSLEYCLTDLFQRLNVKSRIEAVMKARQIDLLPDIDIIQS